MTLVCRDCGKQAKVSETGELAPCVSCGSQKFTACPVMAEYSYNDRRFLWKLGIASVEPAKV